MPWNFNRRKPMELFQLNRRKKSKNVNNSRPQNNINNQGSPQSLESSRAASDTEQPKDADIPLKPAQLSSDPPKTTDDTGLLSNANVPLDLTEKPKETTASSEFEDLWAKAEQRLVQDERMARILKEASQIIEESGLKVGSHGTVGHQQLRSFLNTQVHELEEKKWIIHFGDHFFRVRDQLTRIFKNILVVKDLVNTAASGTPPVAIACAGVTVSLLVRSPCC